MLIKPRPQQKRVLGTYRYFTNLTIESLIRRNIIRRRFFTAIRRIFGLQKFLAIYGMCLTQHFISTFIRPRFEF